MTYENPYIYYIQPILKCILKQKQIPYQRLELVVIDADQGRSDDMDDIRIVLEDLAQGLNYLLLITDEPDSYKHFAEEMYQENGLIVQQVPKSAKKESNRYLSEILSSILNETAKFSQNAYMQRQHICQYIKNLGKSVKTLTLSCLLGIILWL